MKYQITKYECKDANKIIASVPCCIIANDIEEFRKDVHAQIECEKVILTYNEVEDL